MTAMKETLKKEKIIEVRTEVRTINGYTCTITTVGEPNFKYFIQSLLNRESE
ncbi:hypothetical protein [Gottfriedia acidiceleris]|uniref:Uncharacterized protein n=1 Tax=Gottfriedia acidiceleris TaxID=371036 RepID=A0ABY4JH11_9BACI|nr:hypothetical protein [Gottfriedia acidiceleris]UPM53096.1 hypothetical protein MY490_14890 [Gottfriedia acidiceleris]